MLVKRGNRFFYPGWATLTVFPVNRRVFLIIKITIRFLPRLCMRLVPLFNAAFFFGVFLVELSLIPFHRECPLFVGVGSSGNFCSFFFLLLCSFFCFVFILFLLDGLS